LLYVWRNQFEGCPEPQHANYGISPEGRIEKRHQDEVTRLQAALGKKVLEIEFLKKTLLKLGQPRQEGIGTVESAYMPVSGSGRRSSAR
jgi:hypothetical protein